LREKFTKVAEKADRRVKTSCRYLKRVETKIGDSNEILWGTFRDLKRKYSIPRSSGYVLIAEGAIRSKLVRHKGQRGCGRRLVDMRSVEAFLNGCPEKPTAAVRRTMTKRAFASADKRAAQNGD
jgi:hypothetical protein